MNDIALVLLSGCLSFLAPGSPPTANVSVEILNVKEMAGSVRIGLFKGEADFLKSDKEVVRLATLVENTGSVTTEIPNLPPGEYALAIYHDVNDNQKLDTNLFGIPTEPYGFSNNARSKWGPPKYEIARFVMDGTDKKLSVELKKWTKQ